MHMAARASAPLLSITAFLTSSQSANGMLRFLPNMPMADLGLSLDIVAMCAT